MELLVLSFSNQDNNFAANYQKSLERWGYNYQILGEGTKWTGFISSKIHLIYEYLKQLNPEQPICVTDCFDVLACGPPTELLRKFKSKRCRILVGAETICIGESCSPIDRWWKKRKQGQRLYPNGGFYIGKVKDLIWLYEKMFEHESETDNDQYALGLIINRYPKMFEIDSEAEFVINMSPLEVFDYTVKKGRIVNKKDKTKPCFFHSPGMKGDLHYRMDRFGYLLLKNDYIFPTLAQRQTYLQELLIGNKIYIPILILGILAFLFPSFGLFLLGLIFLGIIFLFYLSTSIYTNR